MKNTRILIAFAVLVIFLGLDILQNSPDRNLVIANVIQTMPLVGKGVSAQTAATVSVSPQSQTVLDWQTFSINVTATQLDDVVGFTFDLIYDSSKMSVNSVVAGDYLSACAVATTMYDTDQPGTVGIGVTCIMGTVSSGTILGTITFQALDSGTSALTLQNVQINIGQDSNTSNDAVISTVNGNVELQETGVTTTITTSTTVTSTLPPTTVNMSVIPQSQTVADYATFEVNVTANQLNDVVGYSFRLRYNSSKISAKSVTAGDYLSACAMPSTQYTDELVRVGIDSACIGETVSSGTTLGTITFQALESGTSNLTLRNVQINVGLDSDTSNDPGINKLNGRVEIYETNITTTTTTSTTLTTTIPPATVDMSVEPQSQSVGVGNAFSINITATQLTNVKGFQLRVAYDSTIINTTGTTGIVAGDYLLDCSMAIPMKTDDPGLVGLDNVCFAGTVTSGTILGTISFEALAVGTSDLTLSTAQISLGDDTDPSNDAVVNTIDGVVSVITTTTSTSTTTTTLPTGEGDINGDGAVNYYDLMELAVAYQATEEEPLYNPDADLNDDGTVNYYDLMLLAVNYGTVYD